MDISHLYVLIDLIKLHVSGRTQLSTVRCGTVTFFPWISLYWLNQNDIMFGGYQAESACIIWCGVLMGAGRGKSHWEGCLSSAKLLRNLTPWLWLATGERWYCPHRVMVTIEDKRAHLVTESTTPTYTNSLIYIYLSFISLMQNPPPYFKPSCLHVSTPYSEWIRLCIVQPLSIERQIHGWKSVIEHINSDDRREYWDEWCIRAVVMYTHVV